LSKPSSPSSSAAAALGMAGDAAGSQNSLKTLLTATVDGQVLAGTGLHSVSGCAEDGERREDVRAVGVLHEG
jgi:hypothetical protein